MSSLPPGPVCATERCIMLSNRGEQEVLLTPAEVASLFRVDPKTVTRWAKAGKLSSIRTLGGHRRYREEALDLCLADSGVSINEEDLSQHRGA